MMAEFFEKDDELTIPADAKAPAPVKNEIAASAPGRDITKPFVGPLEQNQDSVIAAKGGGLELYEEVHRDDQVFSCFQQRRLSVIGREWIVDAGGDDAQSKKAADFIRELLPAIDFDDQCNKMLFATFFGYGVAEALWAQDGRTIFPDKITVRKARRFRYDTEGGLRLLTMANQIPGELMPERKFWTWTVGADNDDAPYGLGLGHWCYWPAFFKRQDMRLWLLFLDKYAGPTSVGKYPPGTSGEDQKKLLQATRAVQTASGVIVPDGMMIDLLQAQRSGTADYAALYDRMDAAIAKVILSQTGTTDQTAGKLGDSSEQMEVRQEITKADADLQCASFNRSIVKWLTEWNFPGAAPPRVYRNFEESDNLSDRADRDAKLHAMGWQPSQQYVDETYGPGWTPKPVPLPALGAIPGGAIPGAAFAEPPAKDGIDKAAEELAAQWTVLEKPVAQIKDAAAKARSFAEFKTALTGLRDKLNMQGLLDKLMSGGVQAFGAGAEGGAASSTRATKARADG